MWQNCSGFGAPGGGPTGWWRSTHGFSSQQSFGEGSEQGWVRGQGQPGAQPAQPRLGMAPGNGARSSSLSPKLGPSSLLRWVCSSPWWREVGGQGTACPKLGKEPWLPWREKSSQSSLDSSSQGLGSMEEEMLWMAASLLWFLQQSNSFIPVRSRSAEAAENPGSPRNRCWAQPAAGSSSGAPASSGGLAWCWNSSLSPVGAVALGRRSSSRFPAEEKRLQQRKSLLWRCSSAALWE